MFDGAVFSDIIHFTYTVGGPIGKAGTPVSDKTYTCVHILSACSVEADYGQ